MQQCKSSHKLERLHSEIECLQHQNNKAISGHRETLQWIRFFTQLLPTSCSETASSTVI